MEYLLTCECGKEHIVSKSQADKQIECQCGKALRIPTLRGFSDLPIALSSQAEEAIGTANPWRGWRGIVFAVCVSVSVFAMYKVGMYLLLWSTFDTPYTTEEFIADASQQLDSLGPDELTRVWHEFGAYDMRVKTRPPFLIEKQFAKEQLIKSGLAGGVILIMACVCAGLWISVPKQKRE